MAKWFKKTKRGGITYTSYRSGTRPTTWSQSYKDGSTRTTYTHRGSKTTVTKTTRQGGYTKIEKRVAVKQNKPIKYKAWKSKHKTKWNIPLRSNRTRRNKTSTISLSPKLLIYLTLFAFSPLLLDILKKIVLAVYIAIQS